MSETIEAKAAKLTALLSARFALYVRGDSGEAELHSVASQLVRHLVETGTPPERALRHVKETIPWAELMALPIAEVRGHDPERAGNALIKWCIHEYFRARERAKAEGWLREPR